MEILQVNYISTIHLKILEHTCLFNSRDAPRVSKLMAWKHFLLITAKKRHSEC